MNNTLEGINSRITEAEEWISELENRMVEITASEQNIEKNEDSLRDLWDNIKHTNIHIIGIPEGKEGEKGPKKLFEEIIAENFPSMGKEIVSQVQEAKRVPGRINPRRNTLRHSTQANKNQRQIQNMKSSNRKAANNIQENSHTVIS